MDPTTIHNRRLMIPQSPVSGGMRWRRPHHAYAGRCRGLAFHDPELPERDDAPQPEPGAITAPRIVSAPPAEARVGEEYVYHARAYDANVAGFTWYFETSPAGMAIDRHTGRLTWTPSEGGYREVAVCARSVYGAESKQAWTVRVRKAAHVRAVTPNPRFREALRRKFRRAPRRSGHVRRAANRKPVHISTRATAPPAGRPRAVMPLRI